MKSIKVTYKPLLVLWLIFFVMSPLSIVLWPTTTYAADCPSPFPANAQILNRSSYSEQPSGPEGMQQINVEVITYTVGGGAPQTCESRQNSINQELTPQTTDCTGTLNYLVSLPVCIVRSVFAGIGALFMWIGIMVASGAAWLFELSLKYLIVEFGKLLQTIKPAIDSGWTALRDIANIIIIGMFTFIAINIILGIKEFGDKRKVAQVLIVAVLINFSLLFTKVIVDASNFTAYQFYKSMVQSQDTQGVTTMGGSVVLPGQTDTALQARGIAERFMGFMGVQGIADSYNTLRQAQEKTQYATAALAYGFLAILFLLAVAFVFLYGAFLIVSRAIVIIFLMLTSAVAFASWLIPQAYLEKGFWKWWESLLKTAFFAPILMALLWITMNVADAFTVALKQQTKGVGTLGALASNESTEANWLALLSFVIVLGLLYASFVVANTFSKTIPGFRFGTMATGGTLVGASRLGGILGRNTLGWAGTAALGGMRSYYHRQPTEDERHQGIDYDYRRKGLRGALGYGAMRASDLLAGRTYDMLKPKLGQAAAGAMGFPKGVMAATKDVPASFGDVMERKAKAADALAKRIGPTEKQLSQIGEQAKTQIDEQKRATEQIRRDERAGAEALARSAQAGRAETEGRAGAHEEGRDRAVNEEVALRERHRSEMRISERQIEEAHRETMRRGRTEEDTAEILRPLREARDNLLSAQQQELAVVQERKRQHEAELTTEKRNLGGLDRAAQDAAKDILDRNPRVVAAERNLRRLGTAAEASRTYKEDFTKKLLWDPRARDSISGAIKGRERRQVALDIARELRDHGAAPEPPPAAPPPPAHGT